MHYSCQNRNHGFSIKIQGHYLNLLSFRDVFLYRPKTTVVFDKLVLFFYDFVIITVYVQVIVKKLKVYILLVLVLSPININSTQTST